MLMELTPVRSGTSPCDIFGEHCTSTSSAAAYFPSVLNGTMPNVVHDLRNILTTLNAGVRMLGRSVGQERQEMLLAGMDQALSTGVPNRGTVAILEMPAGSVPDRIADAPGEGEAS